MAGSVFVSGERVLDAGIGAAQLRLARLVQGGWLTTASQAAYQDGIDQLAQVGPFGGTPGTSRLVRVQYVDPVYQDGAMTVGVRWEATGLTGRLFPVLDANIRLTGQGQGSRVVFTACYRPPFGALGAGLDRLLMHTAANATIKTFLTYIAGVLEGIPQPAQETAAPPKWEPGPKPAL
jgi:hypothetical protein